MAPPIEAIIGRLISADFARYQVNDKPVAKIVVRHSEHRFGMPALGGSRRVDPRENIRAEVFVRQSTGQLFSATLSDISVSGFKLNSFTALNSEKMVFVKIPGLESLSADIRWVNFQDYGCEFTNSLHPAVFEHLVAKLRELS